MLRPSRILYCVLAAAAISMQFTSASTANRSLQLSPSGAIRMTSTALTFSGAEGEVIAEVTLTGSLHRSLSKSRGSLMGFITRVDTRECGAFTFYECRIRANLGVPWHMQFTSFLGTLPNITGVALTMRISVLIEVPLAVLNCLYEGTLAALMNGPTVTTLTLLSSTIGLHQNLTPSGERCDTDGHLAGSFTVSPNQTLRLM